MAGGAALAGIGFMVLGVFLFATNDAMGKWMLASYGVGQILLIRSAAALLVLAPFARRAGGAIARPARPGLHGARAVASTLEIGLFYVALLHLPLASVMTFYLAAPIYVTALSALFLKENVGWKRWAAVLAGFCGVLIALGPSLAAASFGAAVAVAGSLAYAVMIILTRRLASAGGTTLIVWQTVGALLLGLALAPFDWRAPSAFDFGVLALLGLVAMGAHVCVNRSLAIAEASVVVPYQYTLIVWAIVYGMAFFGEEPTPSLLLGAALIVASGLFILLRERARGQRATVAAVPDALAQEDGAGPV
ncbi:DMT family transporter [Aureimonas populi]|uniref:DMT family transporter n=1 Tax=Aureimonas populi TaxID=1701758 RepID=A0ABW5CI37_9HYPH|nr:DMT family transporter [Aureimonas populi]